MFIMSMLLPLLCLLELGVSLERGIVVEPGIMFPREDITDSFQRTDFDVMVRKWDGSFREMYPVTVSETVEGGRGCSSVMSPLEIIKSVELEFDPKTRSFVPVTESPQRNQSQEGEEEEEERKAYESALMLLGSKTHGRLKKVFDTLNVEGKTNGSGGIRSQKNFQTGRFKSKA